MRCKLSDKDLSWVALASDVDLLGVDLVWNVDQKDVKVVVINVVWLENDLDIVRLVSGDSALFWDKDERHALLVVINTVHKRFQVEVDWEGRDVLNGEGLLNSLV